MKRTIHQEFFYSRPAADVWAYLTKPELIAQWLMPNDFKPVVGHEFFFRTKPIPQLQLDGNMACTVLTVEPLKKLSYTWKAGPAEGEALLDTVVVWTLEQTGEGTILRLEHSGFEAVENFDLYLAMMGGWSGNLKKMCDRINQVVNDTATA
jgi:uncharacterized protein YndB with AHSA1/START domain